VENIKCKVCGSTLEYIVEVDLFYCKECDEYFLFRDINFGGEK
jgi:hypothetical protein